MARHSILSGPPTLGWIVLDVTTMQGSVSKTYFLVGWGAYEISYTGALRILLMPLE